MPTRNRKHRKSIVHLADYGGPYSGNFLASMKTLKANLEEAGFRLVLVFSDVAKNKPWLSKIAVDDIRLYSIPKKALLPAMVAQIVRIAKSEHAAVLHTHFTTYDIAAWFAAMAMPTFRKAGVIWHVHSDWPIQPSLPRHTKDFLKFRLMAHAKNARVVAVSDGVREGLLSRGLSSQKVEVIENGIDIVRARKVRVSRSEMRLVLGIPDDAFVILCFGWEPRTKGVDTCVEACQALRHEGLNIRLLLVGGAEMEEFIKQYLEVSKWLHVVRPRDCVGDYYSMVDVFFAGSRWEGFPYSVAEAMASGLPVIASDTRGLAWATSCPGVVSFRAGDVIGAIRAMKLVLYWSPEEMAAKVSANRDFISNNYSIATWASKILGLYERILK